MQVVSNTFCFGKPHETSKGFKSGDRTSHSVELRWTIQRRITTKEYQNLELSGRHQILFQFRLIIFDKIKQI